MRRVKFQPGLAGVQTMQNDGGMMVSDGASGAPDAPRGGARVPRMVWAIMALGLAVAFVPVAAVRSWVFGFHWRHFAGYAFISLSLAGGPVAALCLALRPGRRQALGLLRVWALSTVLLGASAEVYYGLEESLFKAQALREPGRYLVKDARWWPGGNSHMGYDGQSFWAND